jgi:hypothetical protein
MIPMEVIPANCIFTTKADAAFCGHAELSGKTQHLLFIDRMPQIIIKPGCRCGIWVRNFLSFMGLLILNKNKWSLGNGRN